jgi:hypothetical protein
MYDKQYKQSYKVSSPITKVCPILDQLWSFDFPMFDLVHPLMLFMISTVHQVVFACFCQLKNKQRSDQTSILAKKCILAMKSISWRSWHLQNHQTPLHIHLPPRHQRLPRFLSIFSAREEVPKLRICELVDGRVGPNLGRGAQDWIKP